MSQPGLVRLMRTLTVVVRRVAVTLAVVVCVAGLGSVLAVSLANKAGYQVLGMKTGSMHPTINPGDLVIARAVDPEAIRNGDVITFRAPLGSHAPYTHRVVRTMYQPDGPHFVTKGDANPAPDGWTVHYAAEGWRLVGVLRHGGLALAVAQSTAGRRVVAASVFIVTIVLLWPVFGGQRRPAEPSQTDGAAAAEPEPDKVTHETTDDAGRRSRRRAHDRRRHRAAGAARHRPAPGRPGPARRHDEHHR